MHINNFIRTLYLPTAIGFATLLSACGGGGGGSSTSTSGTGTLQVALTDAPSCGFNEVNITVSKVRVHQSSSAGENDAGWQDIVLNPAKKVNLLTLTNGILQDLGKTTLAAGHYTQMRLVLTPNSSVSPLANSVVAEGSTTEVAIETPSAAQSGIKLNHEFDVTANAQIDLALDFDACKSIVSKGNSGGFLLKPVIGVIAQATSGGISGFVPAGLTKPIVSAQQNGVIIKSTVPDATGAFVLSPLPQNSVGYVVVVTADGRTTAAISSVPVATGATTPVSTSATPLVLTTSTMRTISGVATPASSQATVRATQTYASGPKVEVTFKSADLTSGGYSLSVPTAAPLLGKFGTLPIPLSADSPLAGKYTIEASATGYATQTSNVDVGTADATKDFTLVP
jgi:hypothetical protein